MRETFRYFIVASLLTLALFLAPFDFISNAQNVDQETNEIASSLDENQNRVLDDSEILNAIEMWILGEALPDGEIISDESILSLVQLWITGESISVGIMADDGVPATPDPDACFTETADFTIPTKEPGTLLRHWNSTVQLPENCDEDCQDNYSDERRNLTDIEVDSKGNIFATDAEQGAIVKHDPYGSLLAEWGKTGRLQYYQGFFIDTSDHVHAVNGMNDIVQKWDTEGKAFPNRTINISSDRFGASWQLEDIVVDSKGVQFVIISWESFDNFLCRSGCTLHTVHKYDRQGSFIKDLYRNGDRAMTLDDLDTIYTASSDSVEKGESASVLDKHLDGFTDIDDIAIDSRNYLYVLDGKIKQYDPSGKLVAEWAVKGSDQATDIAVDDKGHVYVLINGSRIEKYCAGGF